MWRDITGTCPLHNTDITIQVEYIEVKVLNCHLPQYKGVLLGVTNRMTLVVIAQGVLSFTLLPPSALVKVLFYFTFHIAFIWFWNIPYSSCINRYTIHISFYC